MLVEHPHATEAMVNSTMLARKSRFRPNWSLIRPASGMTTIWPKV
jgi:hypothetical protein